MSTASVQQIDIRLIRESDIESFHEALSSVIREQKYLSMTEPPPLESTYGFVRKNISTGAAQYVACLDGKVVGWCDAVSDSLRGRHAHTGSLGMGIIEPWRGQGLGRKLITAVIDHARANGLLRLELGVYDSNVRARRLYEKLGFLHEGTKRMGVRLDHGFEDIHMMGLLLG